MLTICFMISSSKRCSSRLPSLINTLNGVSSSSWLLSWSDGDEDRAEPADEEDDDEVFLYEFLMRKKEDDEVDEVRSEVPRRNCRPRAATAAALSWSVRSFFGTSGPPQRPDTERDTVRLKVLHAAHPGGLLLLATVNQRHHLAVVAFTTTSKLWLSAISKQTNRLNEWEGRWSVESSMFLLALCFTVYTQANNSQYKMCFILRWHGLLSSRFASWAI